MAVAETANLLVKMSLGGNFVSQLGKATSGLSQFDKKLGQTESRAFRAGQQIGTGIRNAGRIAAIGIGFVASQVALGLQSLIKLEQATAQTEAVIKSTGGTAGITAAQVGKLAEKFEALNATVGDEFIRAGENMLLTFTNIRGKAFEPALKAILDINTAMGGGPEGLTKVAIQVGKALNDPAKGVTALRRIGVTFTEQQIKQIKALQKTNDLYGAQAIVLAELNKEFGGSFIAQGNTTAGKVAKFTDSIEDLQRALAEALLPTLGNIADALSETLTDPAVVEGVRKFGQGLAGLVSPSNLKEAGRILGEVFSAARAAAPILAGAAQTMGAVLSTAVSVFRSLPPDIQRLAVGALAINKLTGGLVTNLAGGLISAVLKQLVSGVVNVNGAVVNVNGGIGQAGAAGAAGGIGVLGAVVPIVAAATVSYMATSQFADRNTVMANKGLTAAEIAAVKYYQSDTASQQRALKYLGQAPSRKDLESGLAKLAGSTGRGVTGPEVFGPPRPGRAVTGANPFAFPVAPGVLEAIMKRGRAAGFSPTQASVASTYNRNMLRAAEAQKAATDRVKTEAARTTAAARAVEAAVTRQGEREAKTNVFVDVQVDSRGVVHQYIRTSRGGPTGGSRELAGGFRGGAR